MGCDMPESSRHISQSNYCLFSIIVLCKQALQMLQCVWFRAFYQSQLFYCKTSSFVGYFRLITSQSEIISWYRLTLIVFVLPFKFIFICNPVDWEYHKIQWEHLTLFYFIFNKFLKTKKHTV